MRDDTMIPESSFRRAYAAVLRRYSATFSGLAAYDRDEPRRTEVKAELTALAVRRRPADPR